MKLHNGAEKNIQAKVFSFLQDIIVICKTPLENTVNDVKYWVSEIKQFSPNVSVILALKQGGGEPKYAFLMKEIEADMHMDYLGDNSDGSIDNIFDKAVRLYLMKIGVYKLDG